MATSDDSFHIKANVNDCPAVMTGIAAMTFVNQPETFPVFAAYLRENGNLTQDFTDEDLRDEIRRQIVHLLHVHAPDSFADTVAPLVAEQADAIVIVPEQWLT